MKAICLTISYLCLLFTFPMAYSQATIQNLTVSEGLKKAKKEDRVLMVVMDDSTDLPGNAATSQALADSDAVQINQWAIVIRPAVTSADWSRLNREFYIVPALGTLFFNFQGVLVDRYDAISPHGNEYESHAMTAFLNRKLLSDSEQMANIVKSDFQDIALLETLADTRERYYKFADELSEPFAARTNIDSFNSYRYFHLLARLAPPLFSNASNTLRHRDAFDSLWYQIPLPERIKINRRVVKKTMDSAVQHKDSLLAKRVAAFGYSTMSSSPQKTRTKYRLSLMTDFYYRVGDTAAYLSSARSYTDDYLMTLSVDSLKKAYIQKEKDSADRKGTVIIFVPGANADNLAYFSQFQNLEEQLNRFAWRFYKMTDDKTLLLQALGWSKRSLEFNPDPNARDTYAHLLYATGNRTDGIAEEKKALAKFQNNHDAKHIADSELALSSMLSGSEKID